jgi:hypothetical protein
MDPPLMQQKKESRTPKHAIWNPTVQLSAFFVFSVTFYEVASLEAIQNFERQNGEMPLWRMVSAANVNINPRTLNRLTNCSQSRNNRNYSTTNALKSKWTDPSLLQQSSRWLQSTNTNGLGIITGKSQISSQPMRIHCKLRTVQKKTTSTWLHLLLHCDIATGTIMRTQLSQP